MGGGRCARDLCAGELACGGIYPLLDDRAGDRYGEPVLSRAEWARCVVYRRATAEGGVEVRGARKGVSRSGGERDVSSSIWRAERRCGRVGGRVALRGGWIVSIAGRDAGVGREQKGVLNRM